MRFANRQAQSALTCALFLWLCGPPSARSADPAAGTCTAPPAPFAFNNGPICAGNTLMLFASTVPGATYSWTGPGGFTSTEQNPQIVSAAPSASGTYYVFAIVDGCSSAPASTTAQVRFSPPTTITAPRVVCFDSTGNVASVPESGGLYAWTITNGTITSSASAPSITFTAPSSGDVELGVTVVEASGCVGHGTATVATAATCGFDFYDLPPCRTFDTRFGDPPALVAGSGRTLVLAGRCGIPLTARAVAANVTVTAPTAAGYLTLYAAGSPPSATSLVNYSAGQTRANGSILPLGTNGDLVVSCGQASGTAQVIIDVVGYFRP